MNFFELLNISPGVTAVIGSGGKTSLLRRLAAEAPGTVLLCTTTHIRPFAEYPLLTDAGGGDHPASLDFRAGPLCGDALRKR